ncbi:MAG: cobyric acid synthase [Oscillospiraceae bacterium]|nr:cobyric acid synthase [Oscillospiraceae bacterium]
MTGAIMIQGTMSGVGKSLLTAALCRIFRQDGHSVAPFKSQNMALNSYITQDGLEIGRAQALQAEAAGIEPSALMNPILLKPTTDVGSQVIVNGKVRGNMRAREYFSKKSELIPDIRRAFETLASQYDIIVVEGAGSPVELNLKKDDIVNMGLAEMLNIPVLLVGNIDCGGVFAQLYGTYALLEKHEQELVKGLVVNRFRGDISLFDDGVSILEEKCGKPVIGVVPFVKHDLEDEDSLSSRLDKTENTGIIDIAVIRFPKISNFSDFDVFSQYEGVSVRYVSEPEQLGNPDLLILPGTKSTIADMEWLNKTGLSKEIKARADRGTTVFGICGGFQMLGAVISDPDETECGGTIDGLGLLPSCRTVFHGEKTQRRTEGRFRNVSGFFSCLSGAAYYGYEVHMGKTEGNDELLTDNGGYFNGNVAGCYVHGIFDSAEVSGALVKALYESKGLKFNGTVTDRRMHREKQLDELADVVRNSLDMDMIYKIIQEGV